MSIAQGQQSRSNRRCAAKSGEPRRDKAVCVRVGGAGTGIKITGTHTNIYRDYSGSIPSVQCPLPIRTHVKKD